MDMPIYQKVIDEIKTLKKIKTLNLYMMGEPFSNPNLINFIKVARESDIAEIINVTTNGSLLNEEINNKLVTSGLSYLRVSIYGATQTSHQGRTQSTIPISKIIKNLQDLYEKKKKANSNLQIYVKMIDTNDTKENDDFLKTFSPICDEASIEPVMNWNDLDQNNFSLTDKETLDESNYFKNKKNVCPMPFYTLVIHSDLQVSVCCVDWSKEALIGDLKTQSIQSIWNGDRMHNFRLLHLKGERSQISACKNCTYLHTLPDNIDNLSPDQYLQRIKK
jgi:radical SAM protein with 4Fe4S-binding SPASM domain